MSQHFIVVEETTGKIVRGGRGSPEFALMQAFDGERVVLTEAETDLARNRYDLVTQELVELPPRPSHNHIFNYTTKQWEDPRTPQDHVRAMRERRGALLAATDWTQLPDVPLATKEAWATYRQALRDITQQMDPANVTWPFAPQG